MIKQIDTTSNILTLTNITHLKAYALALQAKPWRMILLEV